MNQFNEQESELETEDEQIVTNPWTMRILAILLIVVFLFPLFLSAFQTLIKIIQPEILPTPFGLEDLLHG